MPEPATPAQVTPPATTPPVATPPAATPAEETVSVSKTEFENLRRDAARASEAQSRAARLERVIKQSRGNFKPTPATPPTPEEKEAAAVLEDQKAERGLMALASDPAYREVLDSDPTLRRTLIKNPLAVLPVILDETPLDADDAISLVKDVLDKRLAEKAAAAKPPVTTSPDNKTPNAPPAGGVNPAPDNGDAEYQAAKKIGNTEHAIAAMISIKGKRMAG